MHPLGRFVIYRREPAPVTRSENRELRTENQPHCYAMDRPERVFPKVRESLLAINYVGFPRIKQTSHEKNAKNCPGGRNDPRCASRRLPPRAEGRKPWTRVDYRRRTQPYSAS